MINEQQSYWMDDYKINDKITIHNPRIGEISDFGIENYFKVVNTLTCTPHKYKDTLLNAGIDYKKISDFDFFCLISRSITPDDTKLLLGDLDLSKLQIAINKETKETVLVDLEKNIVIDRSTYLLMVDYLKKIHMGFINR